MLTSERTASSKLTVSNGTPSPRLMAGKNG